MFKTLDLSRLTPVHHVINFFIFFMFKILDSVKFIRGAVLDDEGREEVTLYQSVMQLESGVYSLKREEEDAYSSYSFTDLNKEYETSATCAILD